MADYSKKHGMGEGWEKENKVDESNADSNKKNDKKFEMENGTQMRKFRAAKIEEEEKDVQKRKR
jgi:hypothetical protein